MAIVGVLELVVRTFVLLILVKLIAVLYTSIKRRSRNLCMAEGLENAYKQPHILFGNIMEVRLILSPHRWGEGGLGFPIKRSKIDRPGLLCT